MKLTGGGDLFLGDGTFLGSCGEVEFKIALPEHEAEIKEWPEIVLEDILDAEYITDQN